MGSERAAAGSRWLREPKKSRSGALTPGYAEGEHARHSNHGEGRAAHRSRGHSSVSGPAARREHGRERRLLGMGLASRSSCCFSSSSQPSCHTLHARYRQYCLERAPTAPKCFFTASYLPLAHGPPCGWCPCSCGQAPRGGGAVPGLPEPPRSSSSTRTEQPSPRRAGSRAWPMAAMPELSGAARAGLNWADLTSWGGAGRQPRAGALFCPGHGAKPSPEPRQRLRPRPGPRREGKELQRRPERLSDSASQNSPECLDKANNRLFE